MGYNTAIPAIYHEKLPVLLALFRKMGMVYEIGISLDTRSNQKPYYYHYRLTAKYSRMLLIIEVGDIVVLCLESSFKGLT